MIQIIIHGRGGQGAVKAAQLLALAASLEGKYAQAFPQFGVERSGAPVEAYCRISDEFILLRSHIYSADYAIVLDPSLLNVKNIIAKKLLVNTKKHLKDSFTFDATSIAMKIFGRPVVNTIMLAAFSFFTKTISKKSLLEACKETFSGIVLKKNLLAVEEAYKKIK
ncbi:MAG: 2-oxoacid:acceptor oxidoreductase family protein [Candidatus Pacearchaeota archaeon]|nr:2-oxoacid:acceptor oxidoreductase family protein [Candidatus Pacearchaeota archaeon]